VAAPAVRQIWDDIYGLEGHKAAVPSGQVPSAPPLITTSGAIQPPSGYTTASQAPSRPAASSSASARPGSSSSAGGT